MDQLIAGRKAWWVIGALAALAALAGVFTVQPLDRDEARYAQATAQMLETGNFVDIRFQDDPRNKKPVGIYWMQALSVGLLSDADSRQIWAYRIPSVIGAMLAALGCFWAGTRLMSREAAFAAAAMLAVSAMMATEGGIAKTDAMVVGLTTMAMAALVQLRHGAGWRTVLIFWAMMGLGVLVKGPVTPMIAGLTTAVLVLWERRIDWLKPLLFWPGPALAMLIVLPWFVAIQISTDGAFLRDAFSGDLAPKLVSGAESHGAWPGYHLLLLSLTSLPIIYFLIPGLRKLVDDVRDSQNETSDAARFLLAWIIPAWLAFEILPTKLPHYVLPVYPALALAAGLGWKYASEMPAWSRYASLVFGVFGATLFAVLMILSVSNYGGDPIVGIASAGIFAVLTLGAIFEILRARKVPALALIIIAALGGHVLLRSVAIPSGPDLDLSQRVANAATHLQSTQGVAARHVVSSYTEPSLVFALGTETRLVEFRELGDQIESADGIVLSIEDTARSGSDFAVFDQIETNVCARREVPGVNYSRGEETVLIIRLHNCEQEG
ncbi:MAG: glucosyltransferase [Hyphobacterium sp.]|nr:MAG: glucosyltransferase [Hyphobacterium sp.]